MMPSAKMDICSSAPPENMLNNPRKLPDPWLTIFAMMDRFTPGVVTNAPMR
jgi:hypothetical protein